MTWVTARGKPKHDGSPGMMRVWDPRGALLEEREVKSGDAMRRPLQPGERMEFVPSRSPDSPVVRTGAEQ